MLHLRRRHLSSCERRNSAYLKCKCPIWVVGKLDGQFVRKSLDTRNLEHGEFLRREIEAGVRAITGTPVMQACDAFVKDAEVRGLGEQTLKKYRQVMKEFKAEFEGRALRSITVEDLRHYRSGWNLASSSSRKRLELLRGFFGFCVASGWVQSNPAKQIKFGKVQLCPTEPFSESEWEKIVWALDAYEEIHPQTAASTLRQLRALVLLLRYSGLRISDCVSLKRERIDKRGRLFVHAIKNQKPVFLPLPESVLKAIDTADEGNCYLFWSGAGKLKTALTDWQARFKKLSVIAGIEGRGFAHRLRASFSIELLNKGVPLEMVATILGNTPAVVAKHYSVFIASRQIALEAAVKATWA